MNNIEGCQEAAVTKFKLCRSSVWIASNKKGLSATNLTSVGEMTAKKCFGRANKQFIEGIPEPSYAIRDMTFRTSFKIVTEEMNDATIVS